MHATRKRSLSYEQATTRLLQDNALKLRVLHEAHMRVAHDVGSNWQPQNAPRRAQADTLRFRIRLVVRYLELRRQLRLRRMDSEELVEFLWLRQGVRPGVYESLLEDLVGAGALTRAEYSKTLQSQLHEEHEKARAAMQARIPAQPVLTGVPHV